MSNSTQKNNRSWRKWWQKSLYKLMSNAMYGKITDNLRIRNDVKLVSNREYSKWTSKQVICHKKYLTLILLQYLKAKVKLKFNKLSKVGCVF